MALDNTNPPTTWNSRLPTGTNMVQSSLESFLNPNSSYIQNARREGLNVAAQRGGINSSIAAGASEKAALDAAIPLAQQAVQIDQSREEVAANDWLAKQNFGRALQGQQFQNTLGMLNAIQEYALADPELYTPEVTSGYSNFFQKNMKDILSNFFKDLKV
jgi:hypothetical protein